MVCSRCGADLPEDSRFCPKCGLDLAPTTPLPAIADTQATDEDLIRQSLADEFELLEELGRGGMALVYRAHERTLEREVAIKVLPFALAFDAEFVERFQREARTSAKLEHPNIIPIHRVGRSGRVIYFSMKYLRGGSLSHVLRRRGTIPAAEVRRVLLDCGAALGYASARGVVHRDIKPDNIMFDEFGQLVLTDFGIAKASSSGRLTGTGMSIGTPHYMSPEQARAQQIDGRSDQYALGIVAWQCLAGVVPFDGEDSFAIGYKHITEPLPTPPLAGPDERRLFEVVRRMTMKDPADRFPSWEALAAALRGDAVAPVGALTAPDAPVGRPVAPAPTRVMAAQASTPARPGVQTAIAPPTVRTPQSGARPVVGGRRMAERAAEGGGGGAGKWVAVLLLAAAAAGAWFWLGRGRAAAPATPAPVATPAADSVGADSADVPPAVAALPPAESEPARRDTAAATTPPAPAPVPADSGGIKVVGLPVGSTVLIDGAPVSSAVTRLPIGRHVVAVSAPRHQFFEETVELRANELRELRPQLVPTGAPAPVRTAPSQAPTPAAAVQPLACATWRDGYNAARECYDVRPRPRATTAIRLPPEIPGQPSASTLLVRVGRDGRVLDVRTQRPSSDPDFELLALKYAREIAWAPATLKGTAVEGWTQWIFTAVR